MYFRYQLVLGAARWFVSNTYSLVLNLIRLSSFHGSTNVCLGPYHHVSSTGDALFNKADHQLMKQKHISLKYHQYLSIYHDYVAFITI